VLFFEGNHMVGIEADTNLLAERVVVVRRDKRKDLGATTQAQGVENVCATKCLMHHFGLLWAFIVMDDIIRAEQDVDIAAVIAVNTGLAAFNRDV
jgi:hypothetical protein